MIYIGYSKLIREQEKVNQLQRCMKCKRVLERNQEKDIAVCDGCSRRKVSKK